MEADSLKFSVPKRQPLTQLAMVVTVINLAMVLAGTAMVVASFVANREFINLSAHIYPFPFIAIVFSIFGLLILNSSSEKHGWLADSDRRVLGRAAFSGQRDIWPLMKM
jgi:hypothetical protein